MNAPQTFDFASSVVPPGLTVIEASAGTGKTYAISHLVPRLLLDGTVQELRQLVLVTFTKDAAKELADRVRRVLGLLSMPAQADEADREAGVASLRQTYGGDSAAMERLRRAMLDMDQLLVATIHSFCQRVLQTEGPLCGMPVMPELIPEADELLRESVHELWQARLVNDPVLASLAAAHDWKATDDVAFVRTCLPLENPDFVPAARDWEESFAVFQSEIAALGDHYAELERLVGDGVELNKKPLQTWRSNAALRAALQPDASLRERLPHLAWLACLDDHTNKQRKTGKAAHAALAASPALKACKELASKAEALQWSWRVHCVGIARQRIAEALRAGRQITYDGIIRSLRDALCSPEHGEMLRERLAQRHCVGIIDESQDTDPQQFTIFKRLFLESGPAHRLVLIGDPKQSIYAFRGADVNTYLAASALPGTCRYTLTKTYRSPAPLVTAVNAFFRREGSLLNPRIAFHPGSSGLDKDCRLLAPGLSEAERLSVWHVSDDEASGFSNARRRLNTTCSLVAGEIERLIHEGQLETGGTEAGPGERRALEAGDFAVLANSRREAEAMAEALRARHINAVISTGENVMASEEAEDLATILQSVLSPRHSGLRNAALATRLLGHTCVDIAALRKDTAREEAELRRFLGYRDTWERQGIAALLLCLEKDFQVALRLATAEQGERRLTNFRHLSDLLQAEQRREALRPDALAKWLSRERAEAATDPRTESDERQLRLESDSRAVQIVTMHKSKGLEYNLVFCPFLWAAQDDDGIEVLREGGEGASPTVVNTELLDAGAPEHLRLLRIRLEDRLRLAYVALTRARVHAWVLCGALGSAGRHKLPASSLDWLLRCLEPGQIDDQALAEWAAAMKSAGSTDKKSGLSLPGRGALHAKGLAALLPLAERRLGISPPPARSATTAGERAQELALVSELELPPQPPRGWGVTSFSALTREKHAHDNAQPPAPPALSADSGVAAGAELPCNLFFGAPAGAGVGTAVHEWIENWDFGPVDPARLSALLALHPLPACDEGTPDMGERMRDMLAHLAKSRLPGLDCALGEACADPAGSEWHFHLPIRTELSPSRLAEAYRSAGGPELASYAAMIEAIPGASLAGYLQGFIDRLALHRGRWGVVDWKTNRLGQAPAAYEPAGLLQCAMSEHYMLQTHLYLVALRRHLRLAVPGAHPAGAWLVFLRAVHEGTPDGVLHIAPSPALLDALDALFT